MSCTYLICTMWDGHKISVKVKNQLKSLSILVFQSPISEQWICCHLLNWAQGSEEDGWGWGEEDRGTWSQPVSISTLSQQHTLASVTSKHKIIVRIDLFSLKINVALNYKYMYNAYVCLSVRLCDTSFQEHSILIFLTQIWKQTSCGLQAAFKQSLSSL